MQQARCEKWQNWTQVAPSTGFASQAPEQKSNDWCEQLKTVIGMGLENAVLPQAGCLSWGLFLPQQHYLSLL